jgi:phosphoribosyl 1,2-cyclic phosphate phosphodiesterase
MIRTKTTLGKTALVLISLLTVVSRSVSEQSGGCQPQYFQFLGAGFRLFVGPRAEDLRRNWLDHGGHLRSASSLFVSPDLVVDYSYHTMEQMIGLGIDPSEVSNILITHGHHDHFNPFQIGKHALNRFRKKKQKTHIFSNTNLISVLRGDFPSSEKVSYKPGIKIFKPLAKGANKYMVYHPLKVGCSYKMAGCRVTPIAANHSSFVKGQSGFNYVLQIHGVTLLYAADTGYYSEKTFQMLEGFYLDIVVMECTYPSASARSKRNTQHLDVEGYVRMMNEFRRRGIAGIDTVFFTTHAPGFAELDKPFSAMEGCRDRGFIVSYDGMRMHF